MGATKEATIDDKSITGGSCNQTGTYDSQQTGVYQQIFHQIASLFEFFLNYASWH